MDAFGFYDFRIENPADRLAKEVSLPTDANGRSREICKERGFQQSLEIDGAIVTIGSQSPDEFSNFLGAADPGTVSPLIRVDGNEFHVQTAHLHRDLVLALDQPVDFRPGK